MSNRMRALRQNQYGEPFEVVELPIPQVTPGNAVVKVLAGMTHSYMGEIYDGTRGYKYPTPITPGPFGIGRVHSLGPDSTDLQVGQLIYIDTVVRSRDNPSHKAMISMLEINSTKLMDYWRDGVFAEYVAVPLEGVLALNEKRLLGENGLGYRLDELIVIPRLSIPFAGLKDISVQAGETIVITPATGGFGVVAVHLAVSLGAFVIAMARDKNKLLRLEERYSGKVVGVQLSGSQDGDLKNIQDATAILRGDQSPCHPDAFFDISPAAANESPHIRAAIRSLRPNGRVSLMGGIRGDALIPYGKVMSDNITIRGRWMSEVNINRDLIRLVEMGVVKIGTRQDSERRSASSCVSGKKLFSVLRVSNLTQSSYLESCSAHN